MAGDSLRPLLHPCREFRDKYEVQGLVGRGAFGDAWLCRERAGSTLVVCKVTSTCRGRVEPATVKGNAGGPLAPQLSEVAALMLFSGRHPGIVQVHEVLETPKKTHIAMEYCTGGDLFDLLEDLGALPEPSAKVLFAQLASAVEFCHSQGVLHRDIKPENVFLESPADALYLWNPAATPTPPPVRAKLADFGLSVVLYKGAAATGRAGSEFYAPPEMVKGQAYGLTADIWGLGLVLYSMLTGSLPTAPPSQDEPSKDWRAFDKATQARRARTLDSGSCTNGSEEDREGKGGSGGRKGHPVWHRDHRKGIDFDRLEWGTVSPAAQDLVKKMLDTDPILRMHASEVLAHLWVASQEGKGGEVVDEGDNAWSDVAFSPGPISSSSTKSSEHHPWFAADD